MTQQHIAVLDDEEDIRQLLATYLGANGFRVTPVQSGGALMDLMVRETPALVLLDLGLPGEDGFAIARRLRERWACGLVIVTGRGDAVDKIVGLEIGADDYVTKPFDLRELLARIKAVLRRLQPEALPNAVAVTQPAPMATPPDAGSLPVASHGARLAGKPAAAAATNFERFRFSGWLLDRAARCLTGPDGAEVGLTSGEFDLLSVFVQHPGRVLSRDFLLESTRGREAAPFDRTVDVQIGRLRKKLEVDSQDPKILKSVRGAGYVLVPAVHADAQA